MFYSVEATGISIISNNCHLKNHSAVKQFTNKTGYQQNFPVGKKKKKIYEKTVDDKKYAVHYFE